MSFLTVLFACIFYAATAMMVAGWWLKLTATLVRLHPSKSRLRLHQQRRRVVLRMAREVALLRACSSPTNGSGYSAGSFMFHCCSSFCAIYAISRSGLVLVVWAHRSVSMPDSPWWQGLAACGHAAFWWIAYVIYRRLPII